MYLTTMPKYMKQKLTELKEKTDNLKIIRDLNIPLSIMDWTTELIINKKIENLKYTIN